ncbi:hypothetical protein [Streptomyces sp. NPDC018000]|uniref:hypothetical protein n=1 Tax=Streptomyces sp. NPDC018000 TaxID=3365028 RepID=UPI003790F39A
MASDAPPHPRMQHVTTAGTALAVTLAPLVIGVLLARTMAMDPMTPVNALVTRGGQSASISPAQWRGCGRHALRKCRGSLGACKHPGSLVRRCPEVHSPRRLGVLLRQR